MATVTKTLAVQTALGILAIALVQPDGSLVSADLTVEARIGTEWCELGRLVVPAPNAGPVNGARVVALAECPAATEYRATANTIGLEDLDLLLMGGESTALVLTGAVMAVTHAGPARPAVPATSVVAQSLGSIPRGALGVGLVQDPASLVPSVLTLEARFGETWCELGRLAVDAPPDGETAREVAVAECPAATEYRVTCETAAPEPSLALQLAHGNLEGIELTQPVAPPSGGGLVTLANQPITYLWVAPNGDDATGQRGRIDLPFRTIQAALDVAQNGDTVLVAPGTYPAVTVPSSLDSVMIRGTCKDTCVLFTELGTVLTWNPDPFLSLFLANLTLMTSSLVATAVDVRQVAGNNSARFEAENCYFQCGGGTFDAILQRLNNVHLRGCSNVSGAGGGTQVLNVDEALIEAHQGDLHLEVTSPMPATVNHIEYLVKGGVSSTLPALFQPVINHLGLAVVTCDQAVEALTYNANGLTASGGANAAIRFRGRANMVIGVNNVTIPDGAIDLSGANLDGLLVAYAGAADPLNVNAQGANCPGVVQMSSTGGMPLIADFRGGRVNPLITIFGADCYLDRDAGAIGPVTVGPGVTGLVFGVDIGEPPFPPGVGVNYVPTRNSAPAAIGDVPYSTGFAGDQAEIGCTNAADVAITWQRQTSL